MTFDLPAGSAVLITLNWARALPAPGRFPAGHLPGTEEPSRPADLL